MSTRPDGQPDLPDGQAVVGAPGLTVAAVARRLGVAPSTLRTWDRRYGLGPSSHAAGTHRRYTPEDLHRLTLMRRLTLEGFPPAEAARFVDSGSPAPARLASVTPLHGQPAAAQPPDPTDRAGHPGGGRIVGQPDGSPAARGLARAAMALDSHEMRRLLGESVAEVGVTRTWEQLAAPVLIAIGERWARTGDSVDVEHALSEAMLGVLYGSVAPVAGPATPALVLLACAEGDLHTLPLHVLAAALSEYGVRSRMLGYGMPADALVAAVRRCGPAAVFLFASLPVGQSAGVVDLLPRQRPAPAVIVGGRGWQGAALPPSVRRVGSLTSAVEAIRGAVRP